MKQQDLKVQITYELDIPAHEVVQINHILKQIMPNREVTAEEMIRALCLNHLKAANEFYERQKNKTFTRTKVISSLSHIVDSFRNEHYRKTCPKCEQAKAPKDFTSRKGVSHGLGSYCKACHPRTNKPRGNQ